MSIPCLDVQLTLREIYDRIALPAVGEPDSVEYDADGHEYV